MRYSPFAIEGFHESSVIPPLGYDDTYPVCSSGYYVGNNNCLVHAGQNFSCLPDQNVHFDHTRSQYTCETNNIPSNPYPIVNNYHGFRGFPTTIKLLNQNGNTLSMTSRLNWPTINNPFKIPYPPKSTIDVNYKIGYNFTPELSNISVTSTSCNFTLQLTNPNFNFNWGTNCNTSGNSSIPVKNPINISVSIDYNIDASGTLRFTKCLVDLNALFSSLSSLNIGLGNYMVPNSCIKIPLVGKKCLPTINLGSINYSSVTRNATMFDVTSLLNVLNLSTFLKKLGTSSKNSFNQYVQTTSEDTWPWSNTDFGIYLLMAVSMFGPAVLLSVLYTAQQWGTLQAQFGMVSTLVYTILILIVAIGAELLTMATKTHYKPSTPLP